MSPPGSSRSFRERVGALRNLPPFLRLVWATSARLTVATLATRLLRAVLPVVTLYVGKLIIDEVVAVLGTPARPATFGAWIASGMLHRLAWLLATEFTLAVLATCSAA